MNFTVNICMFVCAKSLQLCLVLCNPMDCSLPGSSVQGILLNCPPPGDLPDPRIKPVSLALQEKTLPLSYQGSLNICVPSTDIQHNILLYLCYHIFV